MTRLFDLPPDSVDVIPNGVDTATWAVDPEQVATARSAYASGGPLLVFTGRLEWEKGCHTLLDAMPRLRRRHPGLRLVIAGQGSKSEDLRTHARKLRLGRSVQFVGWIPGEELTALAAAADVAVVPSIYEPFGLVALEAAAAGTPLVVGDTGGLRDFVRHGITGLRFDPGDPTGLADAVTALLSDQVLARRIARDARAVLERDYAWQGIAERTVEVYQRAIREEHALRADLGIVSRPPAQLLVADGNLLTGQP